MTSTTARIAAIPSSATSGPGRSRLTTSTGALGFGLEKAADVLRTWREAAVEGTTVRILRLGTGSALPRELRGGRFVVVDGLDASGELARALRASGPVLDTFGPAAVTVGPALRACGELRGSDVLTDRVVVDRLSDRCLARIVGAAGPNSYTSLDCVELRAVPGAWVLTAKGRTNAGPAIPGVDRAIIVRGDLARVMSAAETARHQRAA